MKCREFKTLLNEQLDARDSAPAELERALQGHRSACPTCRAESLGYQALRHAIDARPRPPHPSAGFADRFLDHWEHVRHEDDPAVVAARGIWFVSTARVAFPLAAAAAMLVAVLGGVWFWGSDGRGVPDEIPVKVATVIDPDALSDALVEVTSATWDLALATSAPAARVGREVLDVAEFTEKSTTDGVSSVADDPASEVFQEVGARLNEGARPLSGTARHAFDFLLGPILEPPQT